MSRSLRALPLLSLLLTACITLVSDYDSHTYRNLTELKAETFVLLDRCVEREGATASELANYEALYLHMVKAREYESGKPANSDTARQFEILSANVKEVLQRLQQKKKLGAGYCENKRALLAKAFTIAIATESNKLRRKSGEEP